VVHDPFLREEVQLEQGLPSVEELVLLSSWVVVASKGYSPSSFQGCCREVGQEYSNSW